MLAICLFYLPCAGIIDQFLWSRAGDKRVTIFGIVGAHHCGTFGTALGALPIPGCYSVVDQHASIVEFRYEGLVSLCDLAASCGASDNWEISGFILCI